MNIQIEKKSKQLQEITIDICKADYAEKVEASLKKQRRNAQIPGFRPGNAPMGMIKKMYEKSFIAEEVNNTLYEELYKYLRENKIDIIGEPLPIDEKTKVDFDNSTDFVFAFEVAIQPEFELDYTALPSITQYKIVPDQEDVDKAINNLRKQFGEYTTPETVSDHDFVSVTYGENTTGNFYSHELTAEAQSLFLGKKIDDVVAVDVNTIFADDAKLATFLKSSVDTLNKEEDRNWELTIKFIGHHELAEMNEEFFKKAYPDGSVADEATLRAKTEEKIGKEYETYTNQKFANDAIELLLNQIPMEFPVEFMKKFILLSQKDLTAEALEEKYPDYERSFKWQLLENRIVKDNNITVTEEEVKDFVRQRYISTYFGAFNQDAVSEQLEQLVNEAVKDKQLLKNVYDNLFESKVTDALMKSMQTTVKKLDWQAFSEELKGEKKEEPAKKSKKKETVAEEGEEKPKKKTTTKKSTKKAE